MPGYVLYNNVDHFNAVLAHSQREEHAQAQPSKLQKTNHPDRGEENPDMRKRTISRFFDKMANLQK